MVDDEAFVTQVTSNLVGSPIVSFPQLYNFLSQGIIKFWILWASSMLFFETIPALDLIAVPPKVEYFPAHPRLSTYRGNMHILEASPNHPFPKLLPIALQFFALSPILEKVLPNF